MSEIKYCDICQNLMNPKMSSVESVDWICSVCNYIKKEESESFEIYNDNIPSTIDYSLFPLDPCLLRKYLKCPKCKKITSHCVFNYSKYSMKNAYICETCKTCNKNE